MGAGTDPFEVSLKGVGVKIGPAKIEKLKTAKEVIKNGILILEKEAAVKS